MEVVEILADSEPSVVAYFDQISWSLGDVYEEILLSCQIQTQTEFVGYADLNFHNACKW